MIEERPQGLTTKVKTRQVKRGLRCVEEFGLNKGDFKGTQRRKSTTLTGGGYVSAGPQSVEKKGRGLGSKELTEETTD